MKMNDHQRSHSVRRITLPSGKSIEVVEFPRSEEATQEGLHVCPECRSGLVQPLSWSESGEESWELTLECPNCWWRTEGVFADDEVHELEERLDQGLADLLGDLRRLAHANMAEQVEQFIAALEHDLITPEDF